MQVAINTALTQRSFFLIHSHYSLRKCRLQPGYDWEPTKDQNGDMVRFGFEAVTGGAQRTDGRGKAGGRRSVCWLLQSSRGLASNLIHVH